MTINRLHVSELNKFRMQQLETTIQDLDQAAQLLNKQDKLDSFKSSVATLLKSVGLPSPNSSEQTTAAEPITEVTARRR